MAEKKRTLEGQFDFVCGTNESDQRLDALLADKLGITRSQIKILIDTGQVLVDNHKVKAGYRIKGTESIVVSIPTQQQLQLKPQDIELEIVYEDPNLIVINKPADMVVHPGAGNNQNTLVNALLYYTTELSDIGGTMRPGIVHRLDKDTTGLMLIAKNNPTHLYLAKQMKERTAKRHYFALVYGNIVKDNGVITASIGRNPNARKKMAVVSKGRKAVTHFTVKERIGNKFTLVECRLDTGRTHQIRVHLDSINHPIVGDPIYGNHQQLLNCNRQMLHAYYLAFDHPQNGWMEFSVELPQDFQSALHEAKEIS